MDIDALALNRAHKRARRTTSVEDPEEIQDWVNGIISIGRDEDVVTFTSPRGKLAYYGIVNPAGVSYREQFIAPSGSDPWEVLKSLAASRYGMALVDFTGTTGSSVIRSGKNPVATTYNLGLAPLSTVLSETKDEIRELRRLPPGWNGYDVTAPKFDAIEAAVLWVEDMYRDATASGNEWIKPHVTADENGDVMLEWSNENKALTAYISQEEVTLAKDWGLDIENEMEDADDPESEIRQEWWAWLAEQLPPSEECVTNDESLYRRVPYNKFTVKPDGSPSSAAFGGDKDLEPSVDRAKLRDNNPENSRTSSTQCIASLIAGEVRAISTPQRAIDVVPDPIKDHPELPDNPAHALIKARPPFTNKDRAEQKAARNFRRALARLNSWAIPPPV